MGSRRLVEVVQVTDTVVVRQVRFIRERDAQPRNRARLTIHQVPLKTAVEAVQAAAGHVRLQGLIATNPRIAVAALAVTSIMRLLETIETTLPANAMTAAELLPQMRLIDTFQDKMPAKGSYLQTRFQIQ